MGPNGGGFGFAKLFHPLRHCPFEFFDAFAGDRGKRKEIQLLFFAIAFELSEFFFMGRVRLGTGLNDLALRFRPTFGISILAS